VLSDLPVIRAGPRANRSWNFGDAFVAISINLLVNKNKAFAAGNVNALAIGVILLDLSVQAVHVTNQSLIFAARPEARSPLVGGYMVFYSIGSGIGAISATTIYAFVGWFGVSILGAAFSATGLLFWSLTRRIGQPNEHPQ